MDELLRDRVSSRGDHQDGGWSWSQICPKKRMGPEEGGVKPIRTVPALELQGGDAAGLSPGCSSVVVERASGKVMHKGTVRVTAKKSRWRGPHR